MLCEAHTIKEELVSRQKHTRIYKLHGMTVRMGTWGVLNSAGNAVLCGKEALIHPSISSFLFLILLDVYLVPGILQN